MLRWRVLLLTLFALAMGHLEAVVVVYIRYALGDLHGTGQVPDPVLQAFPWGIEATREVATLIMLTTLAILVGRSWRLRAAALLWTFGIWDATYYAALKIMTGWPAALTTYDVYFLLPRPWGGPVWFPLLADAGMLALATIVALRTPHPKQDPAVNVLRAAAPESRLEAQAEGGGRPVEDRS